MTCGIYTVQCTCIYKIWCAEQTRQTVEHVHACIYTKFFKRYDSTCTGTAQLAESCKCTLHIHAHMYMYICVHVHSYIL